jgi:hypothetical protein
MTELNNLTTSPKVLVDVTTLVRISTASVAEHLAAIRRDEGSNIL